MVAGIVLGAAALAVQVVVGVQWRKALRHGGEAPGNRAPGDR
ncbi:hypothetical protein P9139_10380 [Curtobacterium flaccumfaciens]|nr:hypothetical protein P9139_10380 [Curtobacterium flaccumfaciens]